MNAEQIVHDLSSDEIAELVRLAERLISSEQGRWWQPKPSTSFRVQLATMLLTVATYKQLAEIHAVLAERA